MFAAYYIVIDVEEIHLPEWDLDFTHGVIFGEGVLVNNLLDTEQRVRISDNFSLILPGGPQSWCQHLCWTPGK